MGEKAVIDAWQRIDRWLAANAAAVLAELNGPASPQDLAAFQQSIGFAVPPEMAASYAVHDGGGEGLFGGARFLSLREARRRWFALEEIGFGRDDLPNEGVPVGPVQPLWWHPRWLPILERAGGEFSLVDCAPAEGGSMGQLVEFLNHDSKRTVLAESLSAWLSALADDLEAGRRFEDEGWLVPSTGRETPAEVPTAPSSEQRRQEAHRHAQELAQWLLQSKAIALPEDRPGEALCAAIGDLMAVSPSRRAFARELWDLLMERDDVDEVFLSRFQLEKALRAALR